MHHLSFILALLLIVVACGKDVRVDIVEQIVENAIREKGLEFSGPDSEGNYESTVDGYQVTINIRNIQRDFLRDNDTGAVLRFIQNALAGFAEPTWAEVRDYLRFSLEAEDNEFGDAVREPFAGSVIKVLVYTDPDEASITWVTPDLLEAWEVSKEKAISVAAKNMDRLIEALEPSVQRVDGMSLALIPLRSQAFKASVLTAPSFKRFITKELEWPVRAVIPCRDFIYIYSERDAALTNRLGRVVVNEFGKSGYPLTTEVFRISDKQIEAIGKFPPSKNHNARE